MFSNKNNFLARKRSISGEWIIELQHSGPYVDFYFEFEAAFGLPNRAGVEHIG